MSVGSSPSLTSLPLYKVEQEDAQPESTSEPSENRLIEALGHLKDQLKSLMKDRQNRPFFLESDEIPNLTKMIEDIESMIGKKGGPKAPKANFFVLESLRNVLNVLEMVSIREKVVEDVIETEKNEVEKGLKSRAIQLVSPYEDEIDQPPKFRMLGTEEVNYYTKLFTEKLLEKGFHKFTERYEVEFGQYAVQPLSALIRMRFVKFRDSKFQDSAFATALIFKTATYLLSGKRENRWKRKIDEVLRAETLQERLQKWEELREYPNQLQEWTNPPLPSPFSAKEVELVD
jgi:hypothetical protein